MCGVCGVAHPDKRPVDRAVLDRMTDSLAHRGPDGRGVWTGTGAGLGHRRLAILDLSPAGAQPMRSADGRLTIAYNGEGVQLPGAAGRTRSPGLGLPFLRRHRGGAGRLRGLGPGLPVPVQRHVRLRRMGRRDPPPCSWPGTATG